jgi:hypothetical protein
MISTDKLRFSGIIFLLFSLSVVQAQVQNPAQKKFNVYKADVNPNATKEGIRGISVLFSCEYTFSEAEFTSMRDAKGRYYFTFYARLLDANNEPVYNPFDYTFYKKINGTTAIHFADEYTQDPQTKAMGRRSTGIELFIPYTHTSLPEGTNQIKFSLNAFPQKGETKFENIYTQTIAVAKPVTHSATLTPKQITVVDKAGKRYEVGRLEQDMFIAPGSNKAAADIMSAANVDLKESLPFTYTEGEVVRLKIQKSTQTGLVRSNKPRLLRTADGKSLPSFDNSANLTGEWVIDTKAGKVLAIKNNNLDVKFELAQYKIPPVQVSNFKVNPYATHEKVAGTSVSFDYKATVSATTPPLVAVTAYNKGNAAQGSLPVGAKIVAGKGSVDSTGAVVLDRSGSGKVEVFYPAFNILLNDPTVKQTPPSRFSLRIQVQNNPYVIVQKEVKQSLSLSMIKDATLASVVKAKDTTVSGVHGFALSIPYQLPPLYFELLKGDCSVEFASAGTDSRATDLLRRMNLLDESVKKRSTSDKKNVAFTLTKPAGAIRLFLPYTSLTKIESTPLPSNARTLVNNTAGNQVIVGDNSTAFRLDFERKDLRFVTLGIANIKLKKADTGSIAWRIRSKDKTIYQSSLIPAEKTIENLYTDAFYIHQDDTVILEMLKGTEVANLKVMAKWEMPVKSLTAGEEIEIDPAKQPNNTDDGDTKSLTVKYTAQ